MKKSLILISVLLIGIGLGSYIDLPLKNAMSDKSGDLKTTQKKPLYWAAPMDASFRRDGPGKSPMGMDLVPVYEDDSGDKGSTVKISPEVINNLGVRTALVQRAPLTRKISTVGYLDYDETRISHIHTRTDGWIERLTVRAEGERVEKNQLLFELYSPTLVNAQEEYLQSLVNENKSLKEASKQRLIALGISNSQIKRIEKTRKAEQYIKFYASQSGVLSRLNVREGMYIKPDTEVISIANLDYVWLIAEVFERQSAWVKSGQIAEARLPSYIGRVWTGSVEFIYPDLDPVTRTLRIRLRFDNSEGLFMPNMYAHVDIYVDEKREALSIPREALIRDAKQDRVIVALEGGRFEARQVSPGIESGDYIEIKSGLEEGEQIVVTSQFLIDSESSLKASLQRMEPIPDVMEESSMTRMTEEND
jgi:membrane fusion protein, copper/silver efflux system